MDEATRADIRSLLKTFGVKADEAIIAHLARNPGVGPLHLRVQLIDLTDYGDDAPSPPLLLAIDGAIRPS